MGYQYHQFKSFTFLFQENYSFGLDRRAVFLIDKYSSFLVIGIILIATPIFSQNIQSMEFINQPISDVLLVLGKNSGKSIISDDTVTENVSYYFTDTDFESALSVFLVSNNLYCRVIDGIYYVSKINITIDDEKNLISLDAADTYIQDLVYTLSNRIGKTILYDILPRELISLHCENRSVEHILEIIIKKYPDYSLEKENGFYYLRKELLDNSSARLTGRADLFTEDKGLFSASFRQVRFRNALDGLFRLTGKEYSFMGRNNPIIEKFEFTEKSFDQIFRLLLEQGNGDYQIVNDVFYIIDIERRDILKKFYTTSVIPLEYTNVAELQSLIPSSVGSTQNLKVDKTNNAFILSGTLEEIGPLRDFIKELDKPLSGLEYHRFLLSNLDASNISTVLPEEFQFSQPIVLKESNSFIMSLPPLMIEELTNYIKLIDLDSNRYAVRLKYIKADELINNPPPSVGSVDLIATNNPNILYFKGSEHRYKSFLKDLELLDRPVPQIRYEVLVMQVQEVDKFNWDVNSSNSITGDGDQTSILGQMGKLLSLNFDIVSQFGYQFAIDLNFSMEKSESKVMADTSLNALSGKKTHFQNTETYRYRETEIDPDTGEATNSGVTREITSGLVVEIDGWTSGDGMITMDVKTTISKRDDTSAISSIAIPATTERSVTTQIRTESGTPVIIGGLMQQDTVIGIKKTPFLGDIPLLGYLFRSEYESLQNTEMVVTIVPYLEYPEYSISDVEREIESLYNNFIRQ